MGRYTVGKAGGIRIMMDTPECGAEVSGDACVRLERDGAVVVERFPLDGAERDSELQDGAELAEAAAWVDRNREELREMYQKRTPYFIPGKCM